MELIQIQHWIECASNQIRTKSIPFWEIEQLMKSHSHLFYSFFPFIFRNQQIFGHLMYYSKCSRANKKKQQPFRQMHVIVVVKASKVIGGGKKHKSKFIHLKCEWIELWNEISKFWIRWQCKCTKKKPKRTQRKS